jgi:hypothetical protein
LTFTQRVTLQSLTDGSSSRGPVGDALEDRVETEGVVIVRVRVVSEDDVDAGPDHL